jgi:hypothetical protein
VLLNNPNLFRYILFLARLNNKNDLKHLILVSTHFALYTSKSLPLLFLWIVDVELMMVSFFHYASALVLFILLFIIASVFQATLVGRTLRVLTRILQPLLTSGTKYRERYASLPYYVK